MCSLVLKPLLKKIYFHKAIHDSKNSPQKTWDVLRQLLSGNKKSLDLPSVMNIDEKLVEEPEPIAELFNNIFGNIDRRLAQNINEPNINFQYFLHKSSKVASSIALIPATAYEVFNELNGLMNKNAAGSDDLSPFFIKTASLIIAPYLTYFIEFMFNQGVFPNILKIAKVIRIFKSREKSLIENYRPLSLLPVFSKVIEKLIKTRIVSFINRHDILYDRQNGFRKKRSTIYPLIDVITQCNDNINSGNLSCVIALDI